MHDHDKGSKPDARGEIGQMAVEMALLLPVYFLFMFMVFVYSDWFRVVDRINSANYNLTRGEGDVSRNDIDPLLKDPIDRFGTVEAVRTPSYQDEGSGVTDYFDAKLSHNLISDSSRCQDPGIRDAEVQKVIAMGLFTEKGLRRSPDRRTEVAFKYDNHNYWNAYDSSWTRPKPTLRVSSTGTHQNIKGDTIRKKGEWYGHPIQGLDGRFPNFDATKRFVVPVLPYGSPIPHPFLFPPSRAYYARHLGWRGYKWSYFGLIGDTFNPISPKTYHPKLYEQDNYLHYNILRPLLPGF